MAAWLLILALFQIVSVSAKIRYEGSSVWTLSPSSVEQMQVITQLQRSNTGIFVSPLDEGDEFSLLPTSFHKLNLVAPPHLEQNTLDNLRSHKIHFVKYQDAHLQNRILNTRKYVVSSGTLPLHINIRNFKYDIPGETILAQLYEQVDLIDKITVPNNSPATVTITLSESQTMTQTWELSFTQTLTALIGGNLDINLPNIGGGGLSASLQIEFSSTQTITQSIERSYSIDRQVAIPPFTTIQANGYVNWLNDIQLPFEVTGQVYLDRTNGTIQDVWLIYCPDGTNTSQCYQYCSTNVCPSNCVQDDTCECCYFAVTDENAGIPNVMRDYLIAQGMQAEVIGSSGNFLLLRLTGTFTASLGTDIIFNVTEIKNERAEGRRPLVQANLPIKSSV